MIATFDQNIYLELALTELEEIGIARDRMLAVTLEKRKEKRMVFDTLHRSDGYSILDLAAILGTCFMLLGAIYGFELAWGPIIWGIIGAASGVLLGFAIKYYIIRRVSSGRLRTITSEVVVMIRCEEQQYDSVEKILWDNTALGVSKLKR
ncbi:hypothetical protein [Paenibacillus thermotolerans]|uniref:hypothetical protein n=1 Tax=Paenibacillus thermotolerans TaxID=3027807 RepID=UPI00236755D2|nr:MULTISPECIES: hypothetical protein [unclassified Paenibacillus]